VKISTSCSSLYGQLVTSATWLRYSGARAKHAAHRSIGHDAEARATKHTTTSSQQALHSRFCALIYTHKPPSAVAFFAIASLQSSRTKLPLNACIHTNIAHQSVSSTPTPTQRHVTTSESLVVSALVSTWNQNFTSTHLHAY
jgi:hypothetical protein